MERKVVLYLGGGMMSGVFGAGIVTGLEEANAYGSIKAVYGGSAGAFNAAYFLARQSKLGSTIYWEDLPIGFFNIWRVIRGYPNSIDVDYLMGVVEHKKVLDVPRIQSQPIQFYVKVLNNKTGDVEYLDGKKATLSVLKSAVSVFPYYEATGQDYIDGVIKEHIGLDAILKRHPENRIIVAINHKLNFSHISTQKIINNIIGGIAAKKRTDLPFKKYFGEKMNHFMEDVKKAQENARVLLVHPPKESRTGTLTTDKNKLQHTWELGKREAEKITQEAVP